MKLTNVGLYSNSLEVANFSFKDPGSLNPYILENIDGLDLEMIVPKFSGFSPSVLQQKQYNLTLPSRTIMLRIMLNSNFSAGMTYSELRDDLYRAVYSSRDGTVQLRLNNGLSTIAAVSGFVTKVDVQLFNRKPVVTMTIFCKDSRLLAFSETNLTIVDTDASGKAAFSVTDDVSTLAHGFKFNITYDTNNGIFVMRDSLSDNWKFTITPGVIDGDNGFIAGDSLFFSSEYNAKQLYVVRGATTIHLLDKVLPGSIWPILFPGENPFLVDGRSAFSWVSFSHTYNYWGV